MNLYDVFGDSVWPQDDVFQKDRMYMKKICSKEGQMLCRWVEEVCDEEEYDGSSMYDEYPDILAIEKMVEKAYEQAGEPEPKDWVKALLHSMIYNEICYRRCRRQDFKQRLYAR